MNAVTGSAIAELEPLYRKSTVIAALHVLLTAACLIALFAVYVLAGRAGVSGWFVYLPGALAAGVLQHRLLIVHHETLHRTLFPGRRTNEVVGSVAGGLIGFTMAYRSQHMAHHVHLGTDADPDLHNYAPYPANRAVLLGDLLATLSGFAAVRQFLSQLRAPRARRASGGSLPDRGLLAVLACQVVLFASCAAAGSPGAYLFGWLLPLLTVTKTITFLRNLAEHLVRADGGGESPSGSRLRTVRCGFLEGLVFAPLNFNYHGEHHLYPGIPFYNLPDAHRILRSRADYRERIELSTGYLDVLLRHAAR